MPQATETDNNGLKCKHLRPLVQKANLRVCDFLLVFYVDSFARREAHLHLSLSEISPRRFSVTLTFAARNAMMVSRQFE
jgi:hypothetical protein